MLEKMPDQRYEIKIVDIEGLVPKKHKANANKKKNRKIMAQKTARVYDEQLRAEIDADRESHGKKISTPYKVPMTKCSNIAPPIVTFTVSSRATQRLL